MSYREHKIILGLQSETYQAGLTSVLSSGYKILPQSIRFESSGPSKIIQEDLLDSGSADLAIIGFGLGDAEVNLRIGALMQADMFGAQRDEFPLVVNNT